MLSNTSALLGFNQTWQGLTTVQLSSNITDVASGFPIYNLTGYTDAAPLLEPLLWGNVYTSNINYTISDDPLSLSNRVLQVNYPQGTFDNPDNSTNGTPDLIGGAQFFSSPFSNPVQRALLEYDIYFPTGFPFSYGGKLPGLYGKMFNSDPSLDCITNPVGKNATCWSMKVNWRPNGMGELYAFLPSSNNANLCSLRNFPLNICNDAQPGISLFRTAFKFTAGAWNRIGLHVQVNDIGQSNGFVQLFLNQTKVIEIGNLQYRAGVSDSDLLISNIAFTTYFGGNLSNSASPIDTFTLFKDMNMSVSQGRYSITSHGEKSFGNIFGAMITLFMAYIMI